MTWSIRLYAAVAGLAMLTAPAAYSAESKNPPVNACALLKDDEVAALVGTKVSPGERKDSGDVSGMADAPAGTYSSTCLWRVIGAGPAANNPNLPMGGISFVILNAMQWPVGSGDAKNFLQGFYDAAKSGVIDQTPVPLKVADDALWWGDGVAVRKGDRSFGISVHLVDGRPKERDIEETLAKKIAPRI